MNVARKIKKLINQIVGAFPSSVPQGLTEFDAWVESIVETYGCPCDERSARFVLSSLLMRLGPAEAFKSKLYFANSLRRAAAAQVAVGVQEQIKDAQRKEQAAAQLAEATANAVANESEVPN